MANINNLVLGVVILQIYVYAAPSDVSKIEDIVELAQVDSKPDLEPQEDQNNNSTETRQKRWFNHYGYGFPPISPLVYSSFNKRDESSPNGNYGYDDPINQIHRRLQEIANIVRQPPPVLPTHIPIFYPVIFVPTLNCGCNEKTTIKPTTNTAESTEDVPIVTSRVPVLEDERQNWGFVINEAESDDDDVDYSRPISFEPIKPNKPLSKPAPPVEHGTVEDAEDNGGTQTTTTTGSPLQNPLGSRQDKSPPSLCDSAILSCCHQQFVVNNCFSDQGCTDWSSYGSPCDIKVILRVVEKFRKYYGQRAG